MDRHSPTQTQYPSKATATAHEEITPASCLKQQKSQPLAENNLYSFSQVLFTSASTKQPLPLADQKPSQHNHCPITAGPFG
jgi:hypothetical protein